MKVAILFHERVYTEESGTARAMANMAKVLSRGNTVRVFSFDAPADASTEKDGYVNQEIQGRGFFRSRTSADKFIDMLSLLFTGKRSVLKKAVTDPKLLAEIDKFGPDVIICGHPLYGDFIEDYKRRGKPAKVLSMCDSYKMLYNWFRPGEPRSSTSEKLAASARGFMREKIVDYNISIYRKDLEFGDALVTPAQKDREDDIEKFPEFKDKILYIPIQSVEVDPKKLSAHSDIKSILFFGKYDFPMNRNAIELIEGKIAPKMPEMQFVIAGKNCPVYAHGNVKGIGQVDDLDGLMDNVDLCIAPLYGGMGLKVKILDYLRYGKAVVGTSDAFSGYPVQDRINVLVEDDIDKYPERIRSLVDDKRLFARLQENSIKVLDYFSADRVYDAWMGVFASVMKGKPSA